MAGQLVYKTVVSLVDALVVESERMTAVTMVVLWVAETADKLEYALAPCWD